MANLEKTLIGNRNRFHNRNCCIVDLSVGILRRRSGWIIGRTSIEKEYYDHIYTFKWRRHEEKHYYCFYFFILFG